MDLSDVLYVIDGSLEVEELRQPTAEGHRFRATLYDNIHDPCMLQGEGLRPEPGSEWKYATATATGLLRRDSLEALARRIAGNTLGHDFPVMCKSVTEWMRIPPTLTAGNPPVNVQRPFSQPEPAAETAPPA